MRAEGAAPWRRLLSLAEACARWADLQLDNEDRNALARLARDYLPTRYPDALPEGTPMDHYGATDAEWAEGAAERIVAVAGATWDRLVGAVDAGAE